MVYELNHQINTKDKILKRMIQWMKIQIVVKFNFGQHQNKYRKLVPLKLTEVHPN